MMRRALLVVLAMLGGSGNSIVSSLAAPVSLAAGWQCGGTAYCNAVKGLAASTPCRNTTAPWADAACPRGTACVRASATVWRCAAVPTKPPSSSPPPVVTPPPSTAADWTQAVTQRHNAYRARHRAPALVWNASVADAAGRWASYCTFQHSQNRLYGENLFMTSSTSITKEQAGLQATDMWYAEASQYSYANPGFSGATGHFTALVWVSTKSLGCGVQACPGWGTIVVCNYWPPGNVLGQFENNVLSG